jgi:hypothetical protein
MKSILACTLLLEIAVRVSSLLNYGINDLSRHQARSPSIRLHQHTLHHTRRIFTMMNMDNSNNRPTKKSTLFDRVIDDFIGLPFVSNLNLKLLVPHFVQRN